MNHHPNRPHHHQDKKKKQDKMKQGLHKDWRAWTAVILMLAAMAAYILSEDEALAPGGQPQEAIGATGE